MAQVEVAGHGQLRFFHFSGYEPERPWVLSKYHVESPRVVISEHPVVRELCEEYAGWVTEASRSGRPGRAVEDVPYRFDRLPSGLRVTPAMRAALRSALIDSERSGAARPPGWRDDHAVRDWFLEPVEAGCRTNRYLLAVWRSRPDLMAVMPAPLGADGETLLTWAWASAPVEPHLVLELLPEQLSSKPTELTDELGVNLAGYFTAEMGVGEMGRMLFDGARAAGLPCTTVLNTTTLSRQQQEFAGSVDTTIYPVTIAAVNADEFPRWARQSDPALRAGHTVGMWAWEVEEFTGYDQGIALVDEIWTLSTFSRDAIARATGKPVHVVPLPIRETAPSTAPLDRAALGLPDGPYFLFAFDYFSIFERKNPLGLVEAFRRAFPDGDGPTLVIKSVNGGLRRSDREQLRAAVAGRPDIVLLEQYVEHAQLGSLMAECLAYVSLHRAEGYGLTMAEAMVRARPVIATAYSGNLDFMDEGNSLLVPHELVPVPPAAGPYPVTARWAAPDLDVAAAHLRWVAEHPEAAAELGQRARASVLESGSMDRTAQFVRTRVEEALDGWRTRRQEVPPLPSQGEASIKQARRLVRQPGATRRSGWLVRYDEAQQGRFLAVLQALGVVRRRADRGLAVARRNREDIRHLSAQVQELTIRADEARARGTHLDRLGDDIGQLRVRMQTEAQIVSDTGAHLRSLHGRLEAMASDLIHLSSHVNTLSGDADATVRRLLADVRSLQATQATAVLPSHSGLRRTDDTGADYLGFSEADEVPAAAEPSRGDEEQLVERMRGYVPLLASSGPVLDIACGRGELLRVLSEASVPASGVDLDEAAVARARTHGVDASVGDGLEVAEEADPGSLGAVVAIRLVERLDDEQLRQLLRSAHQALRPGGVILAETVNPHASPTLRGVGPDSLLLLARECGFGSARIVFAGGRGRLDDDLRSCPQLALLATR